MARGPGKRREPPAAKPTPLEAEAPEKKRSWRFYAFVVTAATAIAAVVGWTASFVKNVDMIWEARSKIASWIAPTPVELKLGDIRVTEMTNAGMRVDERGYDDWQIRIEVVATKYGTAPLQDCAGHLLMERDRVRTGFLSFSEKKFSFGPGTEQQILVYAFFLPFETWNRRGQIRMACTGHVTSWLPVKKEL